MPKKKILVVDDDKSLTPCLKLNLEDTGNYEVRVANWAEDALLAARKFKPDLMLLNVITHRTTGGDVVNQFRTDTDLRGIPLSSS